MVSDNYSKKKNKKQKHTKKPQIDYPQAYTQFIASRNCGAEWKLWECIGTETETMNGKW